MLKKGVKPSPQSIEICAVLERSLAFAHTGNAKVLASKLMKPLWLITSLLEQGLPTFNPCVRMSFLPAIPIAVSPANWPTVTSMKAPAIASQRSQVLTYGQQHFEVSFNFVYSTSFLHFVVRHIKQSFIFNYRSTTSRIRYFLIVLLRNFVMRLLLLWLLCKFMLQMSNCLCLLPS